MPVGTRFFVSSPEFWRATELPECGVRVASAVVRRRGATQHVHLHVTQQLRAPRLMGIMLRDTS